MNDEIKEIIKEIECYQNEELCLILLSQKENKALLDYITNLQQENERLNNLFEYNMQTLVNTDKLYEDYKSRCEKAIEYIKYNDDSLYTYEPDYDYEENLVDNYEPSNFREDLLNILQNGRNKGE